MNAFKIALYLMAIVSSATCTILLFRAWVHRRVRLLMWSAICFAGLTLNNVALFVISSYSPKSIYAWRGSSLH